MSSRPSAGALVAALVAVASVLVVAVSVKERPLPPRPWLALAPE